VTRLALREWAIVAEAVARGDVIVLLRPPPAEEPVALAPGLRFWLLPAARGQRPSALTPAWRSELARLGGRDATPRAPLCELHAVHELADAGLLEAFAPFHPFAGDAIAALPLPLGVLVVRAWSPLAGGPESGAGEGAWLELDGDPPEDGLLPALTDGAFDLFAARVEAVLGEGARAL
jgi:hypothetical protein